MRIMCKKLDYLMKNMEVLLKKKKWNYRIDDDPHPLEETHVFGDKPDFLEWIFYSNSIDI